MTILMMNKLHPLSFARKWVLSVGTVMTAKACVGITITIEFGKQALTCLAQNKVVWLRIYTKKPSWYHKYILKNGGYYGNSCSVHCLRCIDRGCHLWYWRRCDHQAAAGCFRNCQRCGNQLPVRLYCAEHVLLFRSEGIGSEGKSGEVPDWNAPCHRCSHWRYSW